MELLFIIAVLVVAAIVSGLTKKRIIIEIAALIAAFVTFVLSIMVALKVSASGIYIPYQIFAVDSFGAIVILIIAVMSFVVSIYSVQYFRNETLKNIIGFTRVKQYFVLANLFFAAMYLAVMSNNPIFSWISIEITTLSTAFLISFYNKPSAIEAAWKYLIINSVGLLLGFFGTLLYFTSVMPQGENNFISWQTLLDNSYNLNPMVAKIAFIFVLIGYGTKIGFVPMHTWKPDAYSKAPTPLGAVLSGALLPVAFVILLKYKAITDAVVGPLFSQQLLVIFGVASIALASLIMFSSNNYKRLLAYSSIENAGVMALGFAFGGVGVFAATLHMIYHSCVKGVTFLSAGNLLLKYNSAKISNIKGAMSIIPRTSVLFIAGFLIVTGTPPFGIFLTKMSILSVGIKLYPMATWTILFFMTIVFVGFFRHVSLMFFSEKPSEISGNEGSLWLVIPPAIFFALLIVLSFYIPPFLNVLINNVVTQY